MKKVFAGFGVVGLMLAASAVTFVVTYQAMSVGGSMSDITSKVREVGSIIDQYYIDDYDQEELADGAALGMVLATGDKWSYYLSADQMDAYNASTNNEYAGIGVTILISDNMDGFNIETVTPGSPADLAGVKVGDLLVAVEGESAMELGQAELVNRVRGEIGTSVNLTFIRDEEFLDFTLERQLLTNDVATYTYLEEENLGYITIVNFDARCAQETLAAIDQAIADEVNGIIFDVRGNPGGRADELVEILDRLLPEGDLFRTVNYAGVEDVDVSDAEFLDLPMVVLVDGNSYSAAEFFAAAMQEYEAATIVGGQTTGKGKFQVTMPLQDGSAVHLSVGKYFTPKGVSLSDVGITPDVEVEYDYTADESGKMVGYDAQMEAAIEILTDFP